MTKHLMRCSFAVVTGLVALFTNVDVQLDRQISLVSSAEARIGRPLTPMSYAGVARRTTRRAVAAGAVVGGAAAVGGAAYYSCRQVVDAYGRVVQICP